MNNISFSSLIHHAGHFIIEGCQVSQASFPLRKSMLATLNHFLFLMCLQMVSRTLCSFHFLRIKMRQTSLYFFQSSFLPFLEIRMTFFSSSPQEPSLSHRDLSQIMGNGLAVTAANSFSTHAHIPSDPKDLCMFNP